MTEGLAASVLARLTLGLGWLVLNGWSAGQFLVALVLVLCLPLPPPLHTTAVRRPGTGLAVGARVRLLGRVAVDIVWSGVLMALRILRPHMVAQSAWLEVPLSTHHPKSHAVLASCISLTPGTISVEIDPDRRIVRVHALHVEDAAATVADIHTRYQSLLEEIYG